MKRNLFVGILALIPALLPAWQAPAFEVADIKPSDPSVQKTGKGRMLPGGRIEVPGYTVKDLIIFSYGITDDMISGGPKWIGDDRFDIIAKAPEGAPMDSLRMMMRSLIADRFGLVTHNEDKPMQAYALTVAKNPPSLQVSAGAKQQCSWTSLEDGLRRRVCQNVDMAEFAKELPGTGGIGIDLPVVDNTGLKGSFDFQFDVGTITRRDGGDGPGTAGAPIVSETGPTIFAALLKIGLKLESRKLPLPVMVIDHVARPSRN